MKVVIEPDPSPEEREAILATLARVTRAEPGSAWWREGVLENVTQEPLEPLDASR